MKYDLISAPSITLGVDSSASGRSGGGGCCCFIVVAVVVIGIILFFVFIGVDLINSSSSDSNSGSTHSSTLTLDEQYTKHLPITIKTTLDLQLNSTNERLASYITATAVLSALLTMKNYDVSSRSLNMIQTQFARTAECSLYLSSMNLSHAMNILAISSAAAIQTNADALAYMNLTSSSALFSLDLVRSHSPSIWNVSCLDLINTQLSLNLKQFSMNTAPQKKTITKHLKAQDQLLLDTPSPSEPCKGDIEVIYVNGICYTPKGNAESLAELTFLLGSPVDYRLHVSAFPNPSNGVACAYDLLEVLQQKLTEFDAKGDFGVSLATIVRFFLTSLVPSNIPKEVFQDALNQYASDIAKKTFAIVDSTARRLTAEMNRAVDNGKALIVVAHSQGNLYMNEAYQQVPVEKRQYIQLLSVATPAAFVGSNGVSSPYVTRQDDRVINALRLLAPVLPSNTAPTTHQVLSLNHDFTEAYLADGATRRPIESLLTGLLQTARSPTCTEMPTVTPTLVPTMSPSASKTRQPSFLYPSMAPFTPRPSIDPAIPSKFNCITGFWIGTSGYFATFFGTISSVMTNPKQQFCCGITESDAKYYFKDGSVCGAIGVQRAYAGYSDQIQQGRDPPKTYGCVTVIDSTTVPPVYTCNGEIWLTSHPYGETHVYCGCRL